MSESNLNKTDEYRDLVIKHMLERSPEKKSIPKSGKSSNLQLPAPSSQTDMVMNMSMISVGEFSLKIGGRTNLTDPLHMQKSKNEKMQGS